MIFFSSILHAVVLAEPKAQVSYCHGAPSVVHPSINISYFQLLLKYRLYILMKLGRE